MYNELSFNEMKVAIGIIVESGHVPNIVGLQGIGKSDLAREFCNENNYFYREITCSLIQEGDLAMPFIVDSLKGKEVKYAVSSILKEVSEYASNSDGYGVLILDEFNRATPAVQSELMNIVLQREIAGYKLHKDVRIILLMNPSAEMQGFENSGYDVSMSDAAIMGRVDTLVLSVNVEDWVNYGSYIGNSGISRVHPLILSYIKDNKNEFTTKEKVGTINNTPRGWSRASDILTSYLGSGIRSERMLCAMLEGTLCSNTAVKLCNYITTSLAKGTIDNEFDYIVELLNSTDIESVIGSFKKKTSVAQIALLEKGIDYLVSNSLSYMVYSNFVYVLGSCDTNIQFAMLDKITADSSLLADLSNLDTFVAIVESYWG